jgi:hypothetical protein
MPSSRRSKKYGPGFCYDPHNDSIDIPFRPGDLVIVSTGRKIKLAHLDPDAALEKLTRVLKDHIHRSRGRSLDDRFSALYKEFRAKPVG